MEANLYVSQFTPQSAALAQSCPAPKLPRPPYLVYFWRAISRSADRGKMTSTEIRGRVKFWAAYQGCGASGRRESHTVRDRNRS